MTELHPQSPHNTSNQVLFILKFLNMDTSEQSTTDRFWHNGTRVAFTKAKLKYPCTGLWKGPIIWVWGHVCVFAFFTGEWSLVVSWMLSSGCEQEGIKPDGTVGVEAFPGESEWKTALFLILSCHQDAFWEGKKTVVTVGDSGFPDRKTSQISRH